MLALSFCNPWSQAEITQGDHQVANTHGSARTELLLSKFYTLFKLMLNVRTKPAIFLISAFLLFTVARKTLIS